MKNTHSSLKATIATAAVGLMCWGVGGVSQAQNPSALSPDLQEVVKLSQARMPDDVIKNYIASTGKSYRLSADDIIYLNSVGVSTGVISALQMTSPVDSNPAAVTPTPTPPPQQQPAPTQPASINYPQPAPDTTPTVTVVQPTPPPPPEVNFQYFHDQLAAYGAWITVNGVTYWRPDQAVAVNPDWRPYYDMGQWVQTENGLYWQSDYTWGDIPFHYGRWILYPGIGWLWAPDYTWGPAWVFWRQDETDGCIGWAPLPAGAVFVNGGFFFNGVSVGLNFDFGLSESCFTFVRYEHFHESFIRMRDHEWPHHIDRQREHAFFVHSVIRDDFRRDDHGRLVNNGIGRDRVENLTRVQHFNFEERNPVGDRARLATARDESHKTQDFHKAVTGPGNVGSEKINQSQATGAGHNQIVNAGAQRTIPNSSSSDTTHGQPGNAVVDRNIKTTGENHFGHDNDFRGQNAGNDRNFSGNVSKVYRPPATGAVVPSQSRQQPQSPLQSQQPKPDKNANDQNNSRNR